MFLRKGRNIMFKNKIILTFLLIFILQNIVLAMGGKIYHRVALNKLNAKLEYFEKNLKNK